MNFLLLSRQIAGHAAAKLRVMHIPDKDNSELRFEPLVLRLARIFHRWANASLPFFAFRICCQLNVSFLFLRCHQPSILCDDLCSCRISSPHNDILYEYVRVRSFLCSPALCCSIYVFRCCPSFPYCFLLYCADHFLLLPGNEGGVLCLHF